MLGRIKAFWNDIDWKGLTTWAWILTAAWIFSIAGLFGLRGTGLDELKAVPLNSLGDFLAGVTSPLAFLWLIVGYLQQGKELKQNNLSLKYQLEELKQSVKAQNDLAENARNEFALTEKAFTTEEAIRKKRSQPVLVAELTDSGGRISLGGEQLGQGREYEFTITNYGATATKVKFTPRTEFRIILDTFPVIEKGNSIYIFVKFAIGTPAGSSHILRVGYDDELSERQELFFTCGLDEDGVAFMKQANIIS